MGAHGAALVPAGARILTHCNAGALATAGYGTAVGIIRAAQERGLVKLVWVDETRPVMQGSRLTAWEMVQEGIPHRLISDVAAAFVIGIAHEYRYIYWTLLCALVTTPAVDLMPCATASSASSASLITSRNQRE